MTGSMTQSIDPGLWLVATPIGNLDDMSTRAVAVLRAAHIICCEDTRHSGMLLKRIGASSARLMVVNEHTEFDAIGDVLAALADRRIVAVITDAGTPGVSDPGARIVSAAADAGHRVTATPGPAAFVMAAIVSGLPTDRLAFDGFLPKSGEMRRERLTELSRERRTTVLYEAPHRLVRTVTDLRDSCGGDRKVALVREMTKIHEGVWRGTLADAVSFLEGTEPRGEWAIVIEPALVVSAEISDDDIVRELTNRINAGLSTRDAVDEVSTALGVARRHVYDLAVNR